MGIFTILLAKMAKQMAHDDDDDENKCQQEFYTLITSRKLFYGLCVCVFSVAMGENSRKDSLFQ